VRVTTAENPDSPWEARSGSLELTVHVEHDPDSFPQGVPVEFVISVKDPQASHIGTGITYGDGGQHGLPAGCPDDANPSRRPGHASRQVTTHTFDKKGVFDVMVVALSCPSGTLVSLLREVRVG